MNTTPFPEKLEAATQWKDAQALKNDKTTAHLLGRIPKVEVEAKFFLLAAHRFDATRIFVERN
ncbi:MULTISPECIES: hypothetical protein [unclassified Nostoc]|uniref:hypothetical protein n=1 Tax=unclassified Nostoc TaxID=2593658 RepID=UPI002AD3DAB2|nr:hypothetical protein [Nostoc sp. DedQUE03]MDZ7973016.1 hypothetical protein [Nostoc sp. DedQUE03]MDZ8044464.1 hypothetical protein [Nostoc sp. DedQUE02]